jgi:hypothetical protein
MLTEIQIGNRPPFFKASASFDGWYHFGKILPPSVRLFDSCFLFVFHPFFSDSNSFLRFFEMKCTAAPAIQIVFFHLEEF